MKRLWMAGGAIVAAVVVGMAFQHDRCEAVWIKYGITLGSCPTGKLRQTAGLQVYGLRRGALATIDVSAAVHYTTGDAESVEEAPITAFDAIELTLVDAHGTATPLPSSKREERDVGTRVTVQVPEVPDGDYRLHAHYVTKLEAGELDAPVALYTPARIHVITDRPLYEPGNLVKFRAVVLRARDLAPLDHRPGRWVIKDPSGEVLLEEKAPAGEWGVVAGTFPLDKAAQTGTWRIAWMSADATDEVPFTVQPFKLPRFRVDAVPDKAFYTAGDAPVIRGAVLYSSGAPVAKAAVEVTWDINGSWPPPLAWQDTLLPKTAVTGANGRFELALPVIPADLQGKVTMSAHLAAVDPAGDRVEGGATVLLSQDGIEASTVTELGDGLVAGFNNRMYVRVTTPDGRVVSKTKIKVTRTWQSNDNGIDAELDEDGVGSLQIDPGAPVNIVIPAAPFRPLRRPALVTRGEVTDLIGGEGASLADQVELDKWLPAFAPCAKWSDAQDKGAELGIRIAASGAVIALGVGTSPLDRCVANVVRQHHLPAGTERLYKTSISFGDPELSTLTATVEGSVEVPPQLQGEIVTLAKSTRDCLPPAAQGALPTMVTWTQRAGSKDVELGSWIKDPKADASAESAVACVRSRFGTRIHLPDAAAEDGLGLVRFTVAPPAQLAQERPQARTMIGYELTVAALIDGKPASTKLRVQPGQIPPLRMRVTPVLAKPGDTVTAELIRGPAFRGSLPKELVMTHLRTTDKQPLDAEHRAKFVMPSGRDGWFQIAGGGTSALVYVQSQTELAVTLEPKQDHYKPGEQAELQIQTRIGGHGKPAAVGLFGVDDSLGQLVTLPGPTDMARLQPQVGTSSPAFGTLDGQALTLGRIRGVNAAAATVLRVSSIPEPADLDAVVSVSAASQFDPIGELTDHFYIVLAELHTQARTWEATAPAAEKMRPATMARLWSQALAACAARGEHVDDAYGRKLRLSLLPVDLLALTDPRSVIVEGTRLPEDVENWAAWVAEEKP